MPKNQFTADNQPKRKGRKKAFKTKLMDTIKEYELLPGATTPELAEKLLIKHTVERAITDDDTMMLRELINKSYPALKSALPEYEFDLADDSTPFQKAEAVFNAVSSGALPADVGNMLIQAAKNMTDIEANTDLKVRIEALEEALNGK